MTGVAVGDERRCSIGKVSQHKRPPATTKVATRTVRIDRCGMGSGYAVASCWLLLALGGGWRRGMGWIEALGLFLVVCRIV